MTWWRDDVMVFVIGIMIPMMVVLALMVKMMGIVHAARTTAAHHILRVRCEGTPMADSVLRASAGPRVQ